MECFEVGNNESTKFSFEDKMALLKEITKDNVSEVVIAGMTALEFYSKGQFKSNYIEVICDEFDKKTLQRIEKNNNEYSKTRELKIKRIVNFEIDNDKKGETTDRFKVIRVDEMLLDKDISKKLDVNSCLKLIKENLQFVDFTNLIEKGAKSEIHSLKNVVSNIANEMVKRVEKGSNLSELNSLR